MYLQGGSKRVRMWQWKQGWYSERDLRMLYCSLEDGGRFHKPRNTNGFHTKERNDFLGIPEGTQACQEEVLNLKEEILRLFMGEYFLTRSWLREGLVDLGTDHLWPWKKDQRQSVQLCTLRKRGRPGKGSNLSTVAQLIISRMGRGAQVLCIPVLCSLLHLLTHHHHQD